MELHRIETKDGYISFNHLGQAKKVREPMKSPDPTFKRPPPPPAPPISKVVRDGISVKLDRNTRKLDISMFIPVVVKL